MTGIIKAKQALQNSYSPYSKFSVGCAILLKNGEFILGTNIENSSFGLTNCAERSALYSTYSQGYKKDDIKELYIIGNSKNPISPCGACRQVISELVNRNATIYLANLENKIVKTTIDKLLPYSFNLDDEKI